MDYTPHFLSHLRITVLRLLNGVASRRLNDSLLRDAADDFGIGATRDQVRTELSWLQTQGLVKLEELGPVMVATLTERGVRVATGEEVIPGVRRPSSIPG